MRVSQIIAVIQTLEAIGVPEDDLVFLLRLMVVTKESQISVITRTILEAARSCDRVTAVQLGTLQSALSGQ